VPARAVAGLPYPPCAPVKLPPGIHAPSSALGVTQCANLQGVTREGPGSDQYVSSACRVDLHEDCPPTILCACPCHRDPASEQSER